MDRLRNRRGGGFQFLGNRMENLALRCISLRLKRSHCHEKRWNTNRSTKHPCKKIHWHSPQTQSIVYDWLSFMRKTGIDCFPADRAKHSRIKIWHCWYVICSNADAPYVATASLTPLHLMTEFERRMTQRVSESNWHVAEVFQWRYRFYPSLSPIFRLSHKLAIS